MPSLTDQLFTSQNIGLGGQLLGAGLQYGAANQQANSIIQNGEIAAMGSGMTAEGYRASALAVQQGSAFNAQVDEINYMRNLASVSRQSQLTHGKQLAAQAGSGIGLGSKSFLMVQSESRTFFEKNLMQMAQDQENKRRATRFTSQVQQANLENKARASDFQAESQRVLAQNQAAATKKKGESDLFGTILSVGAQVGMAYFTGGASLAAGGAAAGGAAAGVGGLLGNI